MIYREPILERSQMALFKWIVYSADMEMVDNDMLEAIDTEAAIVQLTGTERSRDELWLANIIEVGSILHYVLLSVPYLLPFRDIRLLSRTKCGVFDATPRSI